MSADKLSLHFGAMCRDLAEQLEIQGIRLDAKIVVHFQSDAEAITRLVIRNLIPDSVARDARRRLLRNIARAVVEK
jgi:hypothetical protein